ncbi:tyrosine-type recombinase/integrase [Pseudomonas oryzihabitans]|uniref:tyrosine-type recombinase/integrase n=1 Tax=Pseudomonas oryzihabitans TaxID=47885 RepID=UPI0011A01B14|nr:integrase arm-type DNA-binding domain-containing protein [Pseudomonas psychrotolerans]
MHKLTARSLDKLIKEASPGLIGDGGGLYLQVGKTGGLSWLYRFQLNGSRRAMGLGKHPEVSLAQARERAANARKQVADGIDPIEAKEHAQLAAKAAQNKALTFQQCAAEYIDAHRSSWKSTKHAQQWENTLSTYAYPFIGDKPVSAVATDDVLTILKPIWASKNETASRVRNRIELIIAAAKARKRFEGENPAQWKGHLDKLLAKRKQVAQVEHHAALPYSQLPTFWRSLETAEGMAAKALQFTILTACRTSEVLNAQWSEMDLDSALWTIPASRMKARREHKVPLSNAAVAVLERLARVQDNPFVFPGMKEGRPLSNLAMLMLLRRMDLGHLTVHGFRSSFRDWAAEETAFPNMVAEMALAHTVGSAVEAAYRRGDLLEKRRAMMQAWADYVETQPATNVVQLRGRA